MSRHDEMDPYPATPRCSVCGLVNGHHVGCILTGLTISSGDYQNPAPTKCSMCGVTNNLHHEGCPAIKKYILNNQTETRMTDPKTGGQKGSKLQRFSLIPAEFLWALAEHYGKGATKYEDRNWEKGYNWSLSIDALERHLTAWKMGETNDPETGSSHLVAVAWHAIALFIYQLRGLGTNDIQSKPKDIPAGTIIQYASRTTTPDQFEEQYREAARIANNAKPNDTINPRDLTPVHKVSTFGYK